MANVRMIRRLVVAVAIVALVAALGIFIGLRSYSIAGTSISPRAVAPTRVVRAPSWSDPQQRQQYERQMCDCSRQK